MIQNEQPLIECGQITRFDFEVSVALYIEKVHHRHTTDLLLCMRLGCVVICSYLLEESLNREAQGVTTLQSDESCPITSALTNATQNISLYHFTSRVFPFAQPAL